MVRIAKRTGTAIVRIFAMEAGETAITLYGVRSRSRRRQANRIKTNAREEFVLWGYIIFRFCDFKDVTKYLLGMGGVVVRAIPRKLLLPLIVLIKFSV